jgi:hypothetical protein
MEERMTWKYVLAWLPMPLIGIINGSIRQFVYGKFMGELTAHQISTLTGIILFGLYVWFISRVWKIKSTSQALSIGLIWLSLTVAFEFVFGHYVMGNPWSRLLHDYNFLEGRLWALVLIWITIAPLVFKSRRS